MTEVTKRFDSSTAQKDGEYILELKTYSVIGNTTDFGSVFLGSSPSGSEKSFSSFLCHKNKLDAGRKRYLCQAGFGLYL